MNNSWTKVLNAAVSAPTPLVVVDAKVVLGRSMGVAFFLQTADGHWWGAYYNQAAAAMCCRYIVHNILPDERSDQDLYYIQESLRHWVDSKATLEDARALPYCPCEYCEALLDEDAWLETMLSAADWTDWEWEDYGPHLPVVY